MVFCHAIVVVCHFVFLKPFGDRLGAILERRLAIFVSSWSHLRPFWGQVGVILGQLEAIFACLGAILGGAILSHLGIGGPWEGFQDTGRQPFGGPRGRLGTRTPPPLGPIGATVGHLGASEQAFTLRDGGPAGLCISPHKKWGGQHSGSETYSVCVFPLKHVVK